MGVDETGQEELLAVADHAGPGMGLPQRLPWTDLRHPVARDPDRGVRQHLRFRCAREHVLPAQQQLHEYDLLHALFPTRRVPALYRPRSARLRAVERVSTLTPRSVRSRCLKTHRFRATV